MVQSFHPSFSTVSVHWTWQAKHLHKKTLPGVLQLAFHLCKKNDGIDLKAIKLAGLPDILGNLL